MALQTLDGWKTFAGVSNDDPVRDVAVTAMLAEVDDAVKRYLRQNIERTTYTVIPTAPRHTTLTLPQLPVLVSGFALYSNWQANGNPSAFTSDNLMTMYEDYTIDVDESDSSLSTTGIIRSLTGVWGFSRARNDYQLTPTLLPLPGALKVVYTAGYLTVPPSIVAAVNLVTSKLYHMRKTGVAFTSESLNGYSRSLQGSGTADGIIHGDPTVRSLLRPFGRQIFVGSYN